MFTPRCLVYSILFKSIDGAVFSMTLCFLLGVTCVGNLIYSNRRAAFSFLIPGIQSLRHSVITNTGRVLRTGPEHNKRVLLRVDWVYLFSCQPNHIFYSLFAINDELLIFRPVGPLFITPTSFKLVELLHNLSICRYTLYLSLVITAFRYRLI